MDAPGLERQRTPRPLPWCLALERVFRVVGEELRSSFKGVARNPMGWGQ